MGEEKELSYKDGYSNAVAEIWKDLAGMLKLRYHKAIKDRGMLLDIEWRDGENALNAKKYMEACLMHFANSTFKQVTKLFVNKVSPRQHAVLRKVSL